jgi:hypothetical protein
MRGPPGEKINQGGTADIHVWAPGQVVKLFKEGFPPRLGQQEARMTQAGRAIRIRAAVRQAGSGGEASDGDLAADRDRPLLPAYGRADKRAMAADDAARRSGPVSAGPNPSSPAWPSMRLLSVDFGSESTAGN